MWLGVVRGIYYWQNLILRFSDQSPTRQINISAKFSGYTVYCIVIVLLQLSSPSMHIVCINCVAHQRLPLAGVSIIVGTEERAPTRG